jgi:hypothetical protein
VITKLRCERVTECTTRKCTRKCRIYDSIGVGFFFFFLQVKVLISSNKILNIWYNSLRYLEFGRICRTSTAKVDIPQFYLVL